MNIRPGEPVLFTAVDGRELRFALTRGGEKRFRQKFNCKTRKDMLDKLAKAFESEDDTIGSFLYESLLDRSELTQEQFDDLMPLDMLGEQKLIAQIIGVSLPEADPDRPPVPPSPIQ